jgi:hypothetical protein
MRLTEANRSPRATYIRTLTHKRGPSDKLRWLFLDQTRLVTRHKLFLACNSMVVSSPNKTHVERARVVDLAHLDHTETEARARLACELFHDPDSDLLAAACAFVAQQDAYGWTGVFPDRAGGQRALHKIRAHLHGQRFRWRG